MVDETVFHGEPWGLVELSESKQALYNK